MADENIRGSKSSHQARFPNESAEYRRARNSLLDAEITLRRQIEAVAAQRRALPPGGAVPEDYMFEEGEDARPIRMSELFAGKPTLIAYSFMYGPKMDHACPNCTSILDALDGETRHVTQRASLVVIAKSPIARIIGYAKQRGWRNLRLLSSALNSYNADYHGENAKGEQTSMLNVFTLREGRILRTTLGRKCTMVLPILAKTRVTSIRSGPFGVFSTSLRKAVVISIRSCNMPTARHRKIILPGRSGLWPLVRMSSRSWFAAEGDLIAGQRAHVEPVNAFRRDHSITIFRNGPRADATRSADERLPNRSADQSR